MHTPRAALGFERSTQSYDRGRPEYPSQAALSLLDRCGIGSSSRVLELGAGTGKFTRFILGRTDHVLASDPSPAMRSRFHEKFPSVPCAGALAERIPAAAAAFDAVICAQCFHWFADAESMAEIARVLVPGGRLGLIWNVRDDRVSWMTALTEIIDRHTGDAPRYSSGEWKQVLALAGGWKDLQEETRRHVVVCDRATVLDRVASISFIAALEEPQHRQVLDQVEALLDTHPDLAGRGLWDFPYRTDLYWCERR